MGRIKRILCFAMVICITIGFSISTALTASAAVLSGSTFRFMGKDSCIHLVNKDSSVDSWKENFVGDEASLVAPLDTSSYFVKYTAGCKPSFSVPYGISKFESITYYLDFSWSSFNNFSLFDNVSVFFYVNGVMYRSTSTKIFGYDYSIVSSTSADGDTFDFNTKRIVLSFTLDTSTLSLSSIDDIRINMNAGEYFESDFSAGENGEGSFIIHDQYVYVKYYEKELSDVQNEKLDDVNSNLSDLNDALTGGSSDYEGASSDVASGSSDVVNDASDMFAEMEDFEHSWQDSVQGIYDALPDSKNPFDSLQGGLIVQRADGTIISQLWDLIEEHREISIFFTAGLLIVCVYFFLRR